jgi:hypothetical protein
MLSGVTLIVKRPRTYWLIDSRSRARSLSSLSLVIRGQASNNHRLLTEFSRARPSPSIAHTPWVRSVKRQKPRPQRRQVCASREPRTALQSSIFTVKSCESQGLSIILGAQPSKVTLFRSAISAPRPVYALSHFSTTVRARSGFGVHLARCCSKDRTRQPRRRPPPFPQIRTRDRALKPDR